jgi:hypothetical protein
MKSQIFLPQKIKVGFQEREDTYTGKLGYVIYHDGKTWRKEASWESWRSETPENSPMEFDNVPTEGFVLNKKAGGYSWSGWNPRQTYCRVYDPRGFEFEIDIPNLLYILENTNSYVGKGLEGNFVYGWDGKNLVLVPEKSPEYREMKSYTEKQAVSFSKKSLIPGMCYLSKKLEEYLYLGEFKEYGKKYLCFADLKKIPLKNPYSIFKKWSSCSFIAEQIGETPHQEYGEILKMFEDHADFGGLITRVSNGEAKNVLKKYPLSDFSPYVIDILLNMYPVYIEHEGEWVEISTYFRKYGLDDYSWCKSESIKVEKLVSDLGLKTPQEVVETLPHNKIFVELQEKSNGTGIIFNIR